MTKVSEVLVSGVPVIDEGTVFLILVVITSAMCILSDVLNVLTARTIKKIADINEEKIAKKFVDSQARKR